jgi:hypothetical protein
VPDRQLERGLNAQDLAMQNLAIKDGDTVVFYGDSITAL